MKCPGQDRAYWHGERVFEVPCVKCGGKVEFFRDEVSRRCSQCSTRLNNPRVALDCATWCDQAESCMGLSRSRIAAIGQGNTALAGKLIEALEEAIPDEPDRVHRALLVFQHARELAPAAPLPPVTLLSAALLLELSHSPQARTGDPAGEAAVREVLARALLDEETIGAITTLIDDFWKDRFSVRPEIQFLHDSVALAEMSLAHPSAGEDIERQIQERLRTEAARAWARSLFLAPADAAAGSNG